MKKKTGMVLGKFMPPHYGHVYLCDFAKNFVDDLTIVVGTLETEPIPGDIRFQWMKSLFPDSNVVHLEKILPQEPAEHPDFWNLWNESLLEILPVPPDYIFASEKYGHQLAEVLGGSFIPVDRSRSIRDVSGRAVRDDPAKYWEMIPPCVRAWYTRRICVFGPESTGKSTLTKNLADHFSTIAVPEYARTFIEEHRREPVFEDMATIAKGQNASTESLAPYCNRLLFIDTDSLATGIWSEFLFGKVGTEVEQAGAESDANLYLLLDVDTPWVEDPVRYLPENRKDFFEKCEEALRLHKKNYVVISGDWNERWQQALEAVNGLTETGKI